MKCKICEGQVLNFAKAKVLNKYDVNYFQCSNCGFVNTEDPYWLEEAYSNPIARSDVGLVLRNIIFSKLTSSVISNIFNPEARFLDYGCGYGLFVRIMRDLGFNFYGYDKFCDNIFSQGLEATEQGIDCYEGVTAFEVFEHFVNPIDEIEQVLRFSRNILFSTGLLPASNPKPIEWYYYAPHEGQHVSIYTSKALLIIAEKFNLNLYSNGLSIHLLTENNLPSNLSDLLSFQRYEPIRMVQELRETFWQPKYISLSSFKELENDITRSHKTELKIVIDGVFFQLYKTGIARVWHSLLEEWVKNGFAKHVVVLDRAETAPKISGIKYCSVAHYNYSRTDADRAMLQQVCDEEDADLFVSTYYTTPLSTPSVFMVYDMIPEVMGWDLNQHMWREKHYAIQQASAFISISENSAYDLIKFFPHILPETVSVALCGVKDSFTPSGVKEIKDFRTKYGISKPYFILVGTGGYKNTILFFKAFAKLYSKHGFEIVCTGSGSLLEAEFRSYTSGSTVHTLQLSDRELITAYSGAVALIYPSKYEGFGLPVLEALACGCPVITCANASIPEVAGEAALYVNDEDVYGLANALGDVQKPEVRNSLVAAGLDQAKKFSWSKMAKTVSSALINTTLLPLKLQDINLIIFPDWSQQEESLCLELQQVIEAVTSHSNRSQMTLLVDIENISEEDATFILSSVTMNLLLEDDLDVSEGPEISLVGQLAEIQWEVLLSRIQSRIILENENKQAIAQVKAEKIPSCQLDSFSSGSA